MYITDVIFACRIILEYLLLSWIVCKVGNETPGSVQTCTASVIRQESRHVAKTTVRSTERKTRTLDVQPLVFRFTSLFSLSSIQDLQQKKSQKVPGRSEFKHCSSCHDTAPTSWPPLFTTGLPLSPCKTFRFFVRQDKGNQQIVSD